MQGVNFFKRASIHPLAWWNNTDDANLDKQFDTLLREGTDCIRLCLSFGAWQRNPDGFMNKLMHMVHLCKQNNVKIVLSLFQCINSGENHGELSLDKILPNAVWAYQRGFYHDYFRDIGNNLRYEITILFWEICDCPIHLIEDRQLGTLLQDYEHQLRRTMFFAFKGTGVTQPVGFSVQVDQENLMPKDMGEICEMTLWYDKNRAYLREAFNVSEKKVCEFSIE